MAAAVPGRQLENSSTDAKPPDVGRKQSADHQNLTNNNTFAIFL
jgi:hypothetical protein